ncbi:MAG TPA: HAD family hydrolase [Candidatus Dormibacteraeota bacterium]|nr:HAD family hydrolase [Candidatus Dormibacteraeota bacterium]
MRYLALAADYDGTLATDGVVDGDTIEALRRLSASGRKLILVTGRQLGDLLRAFPEASSFDAVVAENGAVLHRPRSQETRVLGPPPSPRFVEALKSRGVAPIWVGQVVVATVQPNETAVIDVIRELGLDLQVILNKGSVMVLPTSVDKASGLRAALDELGLSPPSVVGLGDAENDEAFLAMCGCGVAVANAVDALKAGATYVTRGEAGAGVREVIDELIAEDRVAHR